MQHSDDDTRSDMEHVRALTEVNKCVCASGSIKIIYCIILGKFYKRNTRVSTSWQNIVLKSSSLIFIIFQNIQNTSSGIPVFVLTTRDNPVSYNIRVITYLSPLWFVVFIFVSLY
jgi:hypothetical protein